MTVAELAPPETIPAAPAIPNEGRFLRGDLLRLGRRMRATDLATAACWWVAATALATLGLFVADNLLHFPAALRLVAGISLVLWSLWRFVVSVVPPFLRRVSAEGTARELEIWSGRNDNLFINAVLFADTPPDRVGLTFVTPGFAAATAAVRALPRAGLLDVGRLWRWAVIAVVALGLWAGYRVIAPDRCLNAFTRFAMPLADVPPLGSIRLEVTPDHDTTIDAGDDVVIAVQATARNGGQSPAPAVIWRDGATAPGFSEAVDATDDAGQVLALAPDPDHAGWWRGTLAAPRADLSFRATAGDSASPGVHITVRPRPRLIAATFTATPPAYAGTTPILLPGPPAAVAVLAGSRLALSVGVDTAIDALTWTTPTGTVLCTRVNDRWTATADITAPGDYALTATRDGRTQILAKSAIAIAPDAPPTADLTGADANQLLNPGAHLALTVTAADDHGLATLALSVRDAAGGDASNARAWEYLGPPGPPSAEEHLDLTLDPARFVPGHAYVLAAEAADRSPGHQVGRSRPLVLRIRDTDDLSAANPAEAEAVAALKLAIRNQRDAAGMTDNLSANLDDALKHGRLAADRDPITKKQDNARAYGQSAAGLFAKQGDDRLARELTPLVDGEMVLVQGALADLTDDQVKGKAPAAVASALTDIHTRQLDILAALETLLGEAATKAPAPPKPNAAPATPDELAAATHAAVQKAADDLAAFEREQERILKHSRSLADGHPSDLSDEDAKMLGELAKDEAKEAKFLEEKLTDFSKIPKQDFADSSLSSEADAVWQDVSKADAALYAKNVEVAVPLEQSGLELAKELNNNLERWLSSHPDNQQWKMEEAQAPADVPVSELPKQLEDIIGDLMDKEEAMTPEVDDFSSAWMDNADKGVGWDVGDGPISDMSAKGITGNLLPNQNEVGGRSGEGRNGRSHGQMVGDTAEGKGGRETPSRLDPAPYESGSVKDSAKDDKGGPTGGGKLSGEGAEGLQGAVPPPLQAKMRRLAGAQAQIAQDAGALALHLRERHMPNGDLETAVAAMNDVEAAAQSGNGPALRQRFSAALDALGNARQDAGSPATMHREQLDLNRHQQGTSQGAADALPAGYEDMASRYFQGLAEDK